MSNLKKQAKLESSGIITSASYSQEEWNSLSKSLDTRKLFSWKTALVGLIPLIVFFFLLNLLETDFSNPTVTTMPFYSRVLIGAVVLFVGIFFTLVLFRCFQLWYWPKPRSGKEPCFILAQNGIKINGRYYFWDDGAFRLVDIRQEGDLLYLYIAWGFGVGIGVIPLDKIDPASKAIIIKNLNQTINILKEKFGFLNNKNLEKIQMDIVDEKPQNIALGVSREKNDALNGVSPAIVSGNLQPVAKESKKWLKIPLTIGIFIIILGVGYMFIYLKKGGVNIHNNQTIYNENIVANLNQVMQGEPQNLIDYDDPEFRLRFKYPQVWIMSDPNEIKGFGLESTIVHFEFFDNTKYIGMVNLSAEILQEEYTLEEYIGVSYFKEDEDKKIIESGDVVFAGKPAYKIVYDEELSDGQMVRYFIVAIVDDVKGYLFGYTCKMDYCNEIIVHIETLMNSIEFY